MSDQAWRVALARFAELAEPIAEPDSEFGMRRRIDWAMARQKLVSEIERLEPTEPRAVTRRTLELLERMPRPRQAGESAAIDLVQHVIGAVVDLYAPGPAQSENADEMQARLAARRARLEKDATRALGAWHTKTTHGDGENALLLASHLRASAQPLTDDERTRADWLHLGGSIEPDSVQPVTDAVTAEREALVLAGARRDGRVANLSDAELLAVLYRYVLPRQERGARARTLRGLSATEEAKIVRTILGGQSDGAVAKAMQRAAAERERFYEGQATPVRSEDTTSLEIEIAASAIDSACPLQPSSAESCATQSAATGSAPSLRRSASRRPR